nr:unnamed protein product [Callosobruchus chinensis]
MDISLMAELMRIRISSPTGLDLISLVAVWTTITLLLGLLPSLLQIMLGDMVLTLVLESGTISTGKA